MIKLLELPNKIALKYAIYLKAGFYGDKKRCFKIAKGSYKKDQYIYYCLDKFKHLDKTFVELIESTNKDLINEMHHPVLGCKSCGWGYYPSEDGVKELMEFEKKQRAKYKGLYVCKHCESKKGKFKELSKKYNLSDCGFGKNGMIIKDHGIRDPKESFLGFGGRWFLIIYKNGKISITNNMFDEGSLSFVFKKEWIKHINCRVENFNNIEDLKKILTEEQFRELSKQEDFKKYCQYKNIK